MIDLFLHDRQARSVFDLLGDKENDMTYSLGWMLAKSDAFRSQLVSALFEQDVIGKPDAILLQSFSNSLGITDIEIVATRVHLIIEAKRGRQLPSKKQLAKYADRLKGKRKLRAIVVIAEYTDEFAERYLRQDIKGVPIHYLSWQEVARIAQSCKEEAKLSERYMLADFILYLRRILKMQDFESNRVYVLALAKDAPEWSRTRWIDFVKEKRIYFHPFGSRGWVEVPPNYLAFRYNGKLQHIHHVDDARVVEDLSEHVPEIDSVKWHKRRLTPHLLYRLGPAILPAREVKSGDIWSNGRLWAAIDLLLTSTTIKEAVDLTRERAKKE